MMDGKELTAFVNETMIQKLNDKYKEKFTSLSKEVADAKNELPLGEFVTRSIELLEEAKQIMICYQNELEYFELI